MDHGTIQHERLSDRMYPQRSSAHLVHCCGYAAVLTYSAHCSDVLMLARMRHRSERLHELGLGLVPSLLMLRVLHILGRLSHPTMELDVFALGSLEETLENDQLILSRQLCLESLIQFQLVVLLNWGVLMLKIQLVRWSYVIDTSMTSANILSERTL